MGQQSMVSCKLSRESIIKGAEELAERYPNMLNDQNGRISVLVLAIQDGILAATKFIEQQKKIRAA